MYDTKEAEAMLSSIFPVTGKAVEYIAPYKTKSGKEIALERKKRKSDDMPYYIWMQHEPPKLDGLSIRNQANPGRPYDKNQHRTTGLSGQTAPSLMNGKKAYYVMVEDLDALRDLAISYENTSLFGKPL